MGFVIFAGVIGRFLQFVPMRRGVYSSNTILKIPIILEQDF